MVRNDVSDQEQKPEIIEIQRVDCVANDSQDSGFHNNVCDAEIAGDKTRDSDDPAIKPLVGLMVVATTTKTVPPISIPVPMTRKTILVTGEIDIGPHDNQNNAFFCIEK